MTELLIVVLIVLTVCSGAISGSETALFSLERVKKSQTASIDWMIEQLLGRGKELLLTILVVNNGINVLYMAIVSLLASQPGANSTVVLGIGISGLIIGGEILPKIVAARMPWTFARLMSAPLWLLVRANRPINFLIDRIVGRMLNAIAPDDQQASLVSDQELKHVISTSKDSGLVSGTAHDRLIEIVDLGNTTVDEVMTHRVDCLAVEEDATPEQIIELLREKPVSHILVNDAEENCIGLLTPQDLLRGGKISRRVRKPLIIPDNATLAQAMQLFQDRHRTVALAVDEYGGTMGLLTLAHIGDSLLGPGYHASHPATEAIEQVTTKKWVLPGNMPLEGWENLIDEEDRQGCNTLGGFVTKMLGAVPTANDRHLYKNLLFRIVELDGKRIGRLDVTLLDRSEVRRMTTENRAVGSGTGIVRRW